MKGNDKESMQQW